MRVLMGCFEGFLTMLPIREYESSQEELYLNKLYVWWYADIGIFCCYYKLGVGYDGQV